jgi:hypothetical protein
MVCEPEQKAVAGVELKVNGEEIELNSFAQNIISQAVIGMVKSLRGVGEVETINLKISRKAE